MSRFYYLLLIFPLLVAVKCKSHKNSTAAPGLETSGTSTSLIATNDTTMRFIVSFYSIGSGAEGKEIEKLIESIYQFGKIEGKEVSYTTTPWGREGERDFCFPLKEFAQAKQKEFIKRTKEILKSAKWVHYFENTPCRKEERVRK